MLKPFHVKNYVWKQNVIVFKLYSPFQTTPTRRNECHVISSSDNNVNNMAATGKDTAGIQRIPDDFSLKYFGDEFFSMKAKTRGLTYFKEGYVHKVKVDTKSENSEIDISGRCYRSMRKGESPHNLHLTMNEDSILDAYCSCTAGYYGEVFVLAFLEFGRFIQRYCKLSNLTIYLRICSSSCIIHFLV